MRLAGPLVELSKSQLTIGHRPGQRLHSGGSFLVGAALVFVLAHGFTLLKEFPILSSYRVNLDWLWGTPPGNDGTPATVRAALFGNDAHTSAEAWLRTLSADEDGRRGEGGWGAELVNPDDTTGPALVDITSAGEDVADGIEDGTQNLYEFLADRVASAEREEASETPGASELTVEWRELPRT